MKKVLKTFCFIFVTLVSFLMFLSCGGGGDSIVTNEYLGDLPSIAKNYADKLEAKEQELKENTDLEEAYKLAKEGQLLEDEAEKTIEDYVANNPIVNIPFEMEGEYPFTINDISVTNASDSRINFNIKAVMTEDVGKNLFVYIQAIDKEGNQLTKKNGVMMEKAARRSLKANEEVVFVGSLDGPADLVNFEKLVLISKDSYNKLK